MEEWSFPVSGATIALLLIGSIGTRVVTNMAAEVGYSYRPARNDSTVVTHWPKPIDTKNDIFEIGKVATFKRELDAALGTRGMLQFIQEQPLTMELLTIQNPMASQDQLEDTFHAIQKDRHDKLYLAAQNLPSLVKMDTLSQLEQAEFTRLSKSPTHTMRSACTS